MLTVGIDIGGTKIAGGVVDEHGTVIASTRIATPAGVPDIEHAVEEMVDELRAGHDVAAVGVAAKAAGAGGVASLAGAFASMLNPLTLVVAGIAAAALAARSLVAWALRVAPSIVASVGALSMTR